MTAYDQLCECPALEEDPWIYADFMMQIPGTQFYYVANIPAHQRAWGPVFTEFHQLYSLRRAASTLAQEGLVSGGTFQFLREAVPWTQQEAADFVGVPLVLVQAWESGAIETIDPRTAWATLAVYVAQLDGRPIHQPFTVLCPSFKARVLRVYPEFPTPTTQTMPTDCPTVC